MRYLKLMNLKAAPVGTISIIPVTVTAFCFPAVHVLGRPAVVLIVLSYLLFSPAVVGLAYSILAEKSKLLALVGLGYCWCHRAHTETNAVLP